MSGYPGKRMSGSVHIAGQYYGINLNKLTNGAWASSVALRGELRLSAELLTPAGN